MPRRKRTGDEGGRRAKVSRVESNEEPLVISDSEHEEEEYTNKRSSRSARWKRRENESQIRDMTEDEMLALAMRLSAQEANSAANRAQELEDSDMQKAIEQSLNESAKSSDSQENEAGSSSDQPLREPLENEANSVTNLRRKLSYSSQDQTHTENEEKATSPLPEMPDLSQTASSNISSISSAYISGPPSTTQDKTLEKQTPIIDTPDYELFRSLPESQSSPVLNKPDRFIHQPVVCMEKLSQELILASADSPNVHTQDSTVTPSCADSPFSKCRALTQKDFIQGIKSIENKDDEDEDPNAKDETQIPDEDTYLPTRSSQGLRTDSDTCLSPSRRSQLSSPKYALENNEDATLKSKTPDLKQVEDQTTHSEKESVTAAEPSKTHPWNEFASHMVLLLTDDENEDDGSEEILSPSPVLHKEKTIRPITIEISPTQSHVSSSTLTANPSTQDTQMSRSVLEQESRASGGTVYKPSDCTQSSEEKGERRITYYWGVPFCPVGQNPDEYTRVIMCQMEVYEKSLKEAQRELLRKADWGRPVCPDSSERSFGARRWKRHKAPQLSEEEEENEEEAEKENNTAEEKEEAREESVVRKPEDAEGGQSETYVVLSSPETKDEHLDKTPFLRQEEPESATADKQIRRSVPWDTSNETQTPCPPEQEEEQTPNLEVCDEDQTVCPETQLSENSTPELMMTSPAQPQSQADSEVMEVEDGGGATAAEEEEIMMEQDCDPAEAVTPLSEQVECPMCSRHFPTNSIEVHAAYCDGEADQLDQQSQVVRRTRNKRQAMEETQRSGKSVQMEKCCLCQGLFPSQEYPQHVNLCFERNSRAKQENGLLSALERSEQRNTVSVGDEPGPSDVFTKNNCGPADPVVTGMSESVSKAMTSPPSDCRIDSSKNSQRLSRKRKFKR